MAGRFVLYTLGNSLDTRAEEILYVWGNSAKAWWGWVKTDMAGDVAAIEPRESAEGVRDVIGKMTMADTGTLLKWTGDIHPW